MKNTSSSKNHKNKWKGQTSRSIAANLLNTALKRDFEELRYQLSSVVEAGLLESKPSIHELAEGILEMFAAFELLVPKYFPMSCYGRARHFANDCSFEEQITTFRQEIFWARGEPQEQREAEEIIRKIHNVYCEVEILVRCIDAASGDIPICRNHAPFLPGNIYALAG